MNQKTKYGLSGAAFALFLVLILLVKTVDVAAVGPVGTEIGLSHLNQAFHELTGVNLFWYELTQVCGILALLVAGLFALLGLWELIGRKKLLDVDGQLLALAVLYILVMALYVFFEIVIVNYRPILMPDAAAPEASFPSSHTMLICTVLGSGRMVWKDYIKKPALLRGLRIASGAVIVLTVFGRLICGVHWFTDILGGLLLSIALLGLFSAVLDRVLGYQAARRGRARR